jgi:hypothetical protein
MNGEDERSRQGTPEGGTKPVPKDNPRPAAGVNPFLPEAPPAVPVRRRGKPPPGIISAGGVDMARAHASNIRPAADTELPRMETEKVVLSVETNPRRVQTMRNLEALRPPTDGAAVAEGTSPWAQAASAGAGAGAEALDKTALPSSNLPRDRDTLVPSGKRREKQAAFWIRVATVVVALLLIAGLTRRLRMWTQRNEPAPPPPVGGPLIPPPLPDESATSAPSGAPTSGARVGAANPHNLEEPDIEPSAGPSAKVIRVRPVAPPPPPKPTFAPLFELPQDKKN